MRTALFSAFVVFCALLISACAGGGRMVAGPDGNMYYQLPKAQDSEDHCKTAAGFSRRVAQARSHLEWRDGKKFIEQHEPKSARLEFDEDLKNVERFSEEGKRNYNKINVLLTRILETEEFKNASSEEVESLIYRECMEKMANKTWFPELASEAK